jgi:hypothetical protein
MRSIFATTRLDLPSKPILCSLSCVTMVGTRLQRYGTPRDDSGLINGRVLNPNISSRLDVTSLMGKRATPTRYFRERSSFSRDILYYILLCLYKTKIKYFRLYLYIATGNSRLFAPVLARSLSHVRLLYIDSLGAFLALLRMNYNKYSPSPKRSLL